MPRQARIAVPGVIYHVTARGNNREWIFHDEEDFARFHAICCKYKDRLGFQVYHWVLMNNHIHLLLKPLEWDALGKGMQGIKLSYTRWYNRKYERVGHLWQGRFGSFPVEEETYLLACGRYIERNPVRAGIVRTPIDYRWSSCQRHAAGASDPLTDRHPLLEDLAREPEGGCKVWHEYVSQACEAEDARLRERFSTGALGSDDFRTSVDGASLERRRARRGRPKKGK